MLCYLCDYECDVDCYVVLLLQENGLFVGVFVDVLQVLEDMYGGMCKVDVVKKGDVVSDDDVLVFFLLYLFMCECIDMLCCFDCMYGGSDSGDVD